MKRNKKMQLFHVTKAYANICGDWGCATYLYDRYTNKFTPHKHNGMTFTRKEAKEIVNRLIAQLPSEEWKSKIRYDMVAVED